MAPAASPDQEILRRLKDGWRRVVLAGQVQGGYLALLLARVACHDEVPGPLVVVTPDAASARQLTRDLCFFLGDGPEHPTMRLPRAVELPAVETSPYSESSFDRAAMMQRLGALFRASQGDAGRVVVTCAAALRARAMPTESFSGLCDLVAAEEELDRDDFVARLLACGYQRVQVVEDPGTFAVRGGILDLFPPLFRFPARLEFYADWVETIRLFDPGSQRTMREVPEVVIHPIRETVRTGRADLRRAILDAADAVNHPSSRTRALLEELNQGREFFGVEALTPAFHPEMVPVWRYLPEDAPRVLVDPDGIRAALAEGDERAAAAHQARLDQGLLTFAPEQFYVARKEVQEHLSGASRVEVPAALSSEDGADAVIGLARDNADLVAELARARSQKGEAILGALAARVNRWVGEARPVVVAAGGRGQADRLEALLRGHNLNPALEDELQSIAPRLLQGEAAVRAGLTVSAGSLGKGFRIPGGPVLLSEAEIFGPRARRAPARKMAGPGLGTCATSRRGTSWCTPPTAWPATSGW